MRNTSQQGRQAADESIEWNSSNAISYAVYMPNSDEVSFEALFFWFGDIMAEVHMSSHVVTIFAGSPMGSLHCFLTGLLLFWCPRGLSNGLSEDCLWIFQGVPGDSGVNFSRDFFRTTRPVNFFVDFLSRFGRCALHIKNNVKRSV